MLVSPAPLFFSDTSHRSGMSERGMSSALSDEALSKLQEVFNSIDTDRSGAVSADEFRAACSKLSLTVSQQELNEFLASDTSGDQQLDFVEFTNFYVSQLRGVFQQIDQDGSGEINPHELREAFSKLGYSATEREIKIVLDEVDKDNNQLVDFTEFCSYFCSMPSPSVRGVIEKWASGLSVDIGSDLAPPPLPPASVPIWRALLAGGLAGVVSRTATAPFEKIKLLAQTSTNGGQMHFMSTWQSVVARETWRGLFAGNGANCIRILPFSALVCLAYSNLASNFPLDKTRASHKQSMWRMGAGATAGVFGTVLTHPIDVIRARLTVQRPNEATAYRGLWHGLTSLARHEGLPGLYRGIGPTLVAIAPFMAVQQSSYDLLKHKATSLGMHPSPWLFLVCGSAAGMSAQTVIYPLEVMRRRMQVSGRTSVMQVSGRTSVMSLLRSLTMQEMFAGLLATYMKVMPAAAISLLIRDALLGRIGAK